MISAQMVSDAWENVEKTGDPFGTTYCLNRSKHDDISSATLGLQELSRNRFERQLPTSLRRHVCAGTGCRQKTRCKRHRLTMRLRLGVVIRNLLGRSRAFAVPPMLRNVGLRLCCAVTTFIARPEISYQVYSVLPLDFFFA